MLRINASTSAAGAKKYFNEELDRGDYYLDAHEIGGRWHGKGAAILGLSGAVEKESFYLLCDNLHPQTGERLTPRHKDQRRVGYDFTFSAPKSVSLLHARTGDERIAKAFRESIVETMDEMEREMATRVRAKGENEDRITGNMVWAEFVHFTARPVDGIPDPHLHSHCYVFNATHDPIEDRWKAGQFGGLKFDAPYYEAAFDARFAKRLVELGYEIERRPSRNEKAWEIGGVPESAIEKFSRRTAEIEAAAERRGIRTEGLKSELGAQTRENKRNALAPELVQAAWQSRLSVDEELALQAVEQRAAEGPALAALEMSSREALDYALAHGFERQSVIGEKRLLESALRAGVGSVSVEETRQACDSHEAILRRDSDRGQLVTTREVLEEEKAMIAFAQEGRGVCKPLGRADFEFEASYLGPEQKRAVEHVLDSQSRVVIVSGGAGVGKTTLMREAVRGVEEGGHRVFTFAPSAQASRGVLRSEGFENAETVSRLLVDEKLQEAVRGEVLWVDEAGLMGAKSMRQLFDLAERENARVVLSGDAGQHASVARGDALRILQEQAGIQAAEVKTIRRQRGAYKKAVEAISRGDLEQGFRRLDAMGAIQELDEENRHGQLAADYLQTVVEEKRSALVVSPTHREGEAVTELIREGLREHGAIGPTERGFVRQVNLSWTEAQRKDARNYEPGLVVQFHQNAKDFTGKVPMLSMSPQGNLTIEQEFLPHERKFELGYDYQGNVSVVGEFEQKGIRRGEQFVITHRDEDENVWMRDSAGKVKILSLDQAEKFNVYQGRTLGISVGDRIRITKNGFTTDKKHRLENGFIYEVAGFTDTGDLRLANGWVVSQDYGNLAHGYCVTSHAAQGNTVDRVFVAQGAESLPASSVEQFYVSVSRGRESATIYTDSKEELLDAVRRSGRRLSATELALEEPRGGIQERWKATALWVNRLADQARGLAARAKESILEKYTASERSAERQEVVERHTTRSPEAEEVVQKYAAPERSVEQQELVDRYTKKARDAEKEELIRKYSGTTIERGDRDDGRDRNGDE